MKFKSKLKKHITTIASIKASWLADIFISESATWIKCPDSTTFKELSSKLDVVFGYEYAADLILCVRNPHDTIEVVKNINDMITEIKIIRI